MWKSGNKRVICNLKFTATLVTIAKMKKQLKCFWTDEWISKTWHIYNNEILFCLNKENLDMQEHGLTLRNYAK